MTHPDDDIASPDLPEQTVVAAAPSVQDPPAEPQRVLRLKDVFAATDRWVGSLGVPVMVKPTALGREYDFPTDISELTSKKLGELSMQLTAYHTYLVQVLGRESADLGAIEEVYNLRLGLAMAEENARSPGRIVKEILIATAIHHSEELGRMHRALLGRRHRIKQVEAQSEVFHEQLLRLSREQSRRESEAGPGRGW